jgi:hypothetical protein
MPDGTIRQRSWLSYSKTSDEAHCLPCILFLGLGDWKFGLHLVLTTAEMVNMIFNDMKSQQSIAKQKLQKVTDGNACQLMS